MVYLVCMQITALLASAEHHRLFCVVKLFGLLFNPHETVKEKSLNFEQFAGGSFSQLSRDLSSGYSVQ